jgi:hypothetical protein
MDRDVQMTQVNLVKHGTVISNVVDGEEMFSVKENGDIFYKGKKVTTDKELRLLLEVVLTEREKCKCSGVKK